MLIFLTDFVSRQSGWRLRGVLMLAGIMATLSLPPFFAFPLLLLAFPILFIAIENAPKLRYAFMAGWWFGLGFFVSGLYWVSYSLLVDAARFAWLIPFALIGLNGLLAIHIGLVGAVMYTLRKLPRYLKLMLFAMVWLAIEYLRGHWFTGFPWNLIGYSLNITAETVQLASVFGIYGLGLIVMLWSVSLLFHKRVAIMLLVSIPFMLCIFGIWRITENNHDGEYTNIRIIQPNISQTLKWQRTANMDIFAKHIRMSAKDADTANIVIWPETAVPFSYEEGVLWPEAFSKMLPENAVLITGVNRYEREPLQVFNSMMVFNHHGSAIAIYDKKHLVPFGEYVPFRSLIPLEKITPGQLDFSVGKTEKTISIQDVPAFLPLICYESIFPELSHHYDESDTPQWILNITNDGWFGYSTGPYQHLEMARIRAVEQGIPLVRVANTGVSAVFDEYGRKLVASQLETEAIINIPLWHDRSIETIYGRYGDYMALLMVAVCVVVSSIFWGLMVLARKRT